MRRRTADWIENVRANTWMIWQYSDHGTIRGVATKYDTDYFRGSASEFPNLIVA